MALAVKPELDSCAEQIKQQAKRLFAARGFDSVSINDIAQAAACSKANIFHHFGSKEALYFDVMRQAMQRSAASIRQVMVDNKDPRSRLIQTVKDHYAIICEDPERSRLMMREVMFSSPLRGQELAEEVFGEQFAALTELMQSIGCDDADNGKLEMLAFMLISTNVMRFHCNNVLQHLQDAKFADPEDKYAELLADMLLQNLNGG